ncbi:MAG: hypothetical protein R3C61_00040 [Bacteroidia bacterium]
MGRMPAFSHLSKNQEAAIIAYLYNQKGTEKVVIENKNPEKKTASATSRHTAIFTIRRDFRQ